MKPIETNKLLNFAEFVSHRTYIETGSCHGGSIIRAQNAGFTLIKSVEVFEDFYIKCTELFKNDPEVFLYLGESREELPNMLDDIFEPAVFFLDAHPAGPNTGGHDDLMEKGDKSEFHQDFILTEELKIILNNNPNHIIIIDDQNGENPDNEAYRKMILEANPNYRFYFYDEQAGNKFYKNKSLVCIPE